MIKGLIYRFQSGGKTPTVSAPITKELAPAPAQQKLSFNKAFAIARSRGLKEFAWNGGSYTTQLASEITEKPAPTFTKVRDSSRIDDEPSQQEIVTKPIPKPEGKKPIPTSPGFPIITDPTRSRIGVTPLPSTPIVNKPVAVDKPINVLQTMATPNNIVDRDGVNPNKPKETIPTKKSAPYVPEPLPQQLPALVDKGVVKPKAKYVPDPLPQQLSAPKEFMPKDVLERVRINQKNKNYETFGGKYYVMSKEDGHIYAFNNKHELLDSTNAGRGKTIGDKINRSDPDTETPGNHAYTRAGSAVLTEEDTPSNRANYGTPFYRMTYHDAWGSSESLGLHGIYKTEKEFRDAIINDPNKLDKLVSWGCINVDPNWLMNSKTKPNTGDSLYVTKEPQRNLPKGLMK